TGFKVYGSGGTNQISMSYANINYAANFMNLTYTSDGPLNFSHCNFSFNRYPDGASGDFAVLKFDSCRFEGNLYGVYWNDGGDQVYATNCTFINDTVGTNAVHVSNCYFSGCGEAVHGGGEANATVDHCEIRNCNFGASWS